MGVGIVQTSREAVWLEAGRGVSRDIPELVIGEILQRGAGGDVDDAARAAEVIGRRRSSPN
jgi:hypothetical protein